MADVRFVFDRDVLGDDLTDSLSALAAQGDFTAMGLMIAETLDDTPETPEHAALRATLESTGKLLTHIYLIGADTYAQIQQLQAAEDWDAIIALATESLGKPDITDAQSNYFTNLRNLATDVKTTAAAAAAAEAARGTHPDPTEPQPPTTDPQEPGGGGVAASIASGLQSARDAVTSATPYQLPSTIQAGVDAIGGLNMARIGATISENVGGFGRYMLNVFNAMPNTGWGLAGKFLMLFVGAMVSWNVLSSLPNLFRNLFSAKTALIIGGIFGAALLVDYFNKDHTTPDPINRNSPGRQRPPDTGDRTLNDNRVGSTFDHIENGGVVQGASLHVPASPEGVRLALAPTGLQTEFATAALAISDDRSIPGLDRDIRASSHDGVPFTAVRYTDVDGSSGWGNASDTAAGMALAANQDHIYIAAQAGLDASHVASSVAAPVVRTGNGHLPAGLSGAPVMSASYDATGHDNALGMYGSEVRRDIAADALAPQVLAQAAPVTFADLART